MRGRFAGLIVSAVLSSLSIALFLYPGSLRPGLQGRHRDGGAHRGAADFGKIRAALAAQGVREPGMQRFGADDEVRISLEAQPTSRAISRWWQGAGGLEAAQPGTKVLRTDEVGASVSAELFRNGLLALGISLLMILVYIWFRFEWQFASARW